MRLTAPNPCRRVQCDAACGHLLPGVGLSVVHRSPVCLLAVVEANALLGKPEMNNSEIARYLGVTETTVRNDMDSAARKMRRALKEAA